MDGEYSVGDVVKAAGYGTLLGLLTGTALEDMGNITPESTQDYTSWITTIGGGIVAGTAGGPMYNYLKDNLPQVAKGTAISLMGLAALASGGGSSALEDAINVEPKGFLDYALGTIGTIGTAVAAVAVGAKDYLFGRGSESELEVSYDDFDDSEYEGGSLLDFDVNEVDPTSDSGDSFGDNNNYFLDGDNLSDDFD